MVLSKKIIVRFFPRSRDTYLYKLFPVSIFFSFLAFTGHAQPSNKDYPVQFSQFFLGYSLVNPSSIGSDANTEIKLFYQRPVSGFTGVSTYFCSISFIPYRIRSAARSKSVVGFRFYGDNEGAYINRTRFYGMYAFHTSINSRLNFAGGIDFGGMNFSVKATPTTEGASVFRADANTGIWFYNTRFHAGFSVNQLFNSAFQPIDERIILPTYVNITASYALIKQKNIELRPHILIAYPYYSGTSIQTALYGLFFEKLITSIGWNRKTSISAMLGWDNIQVFRGNLSAVLSYGTPVQHAALSINKLEASVLYSF
jgi:type IX secretion system PorP/SprF family membrane protein